MTVLRIQGLLGGVGGEITPYMPHDQALDPARYMNTGGEAWH
jgi:hypothetical protein